MKYQRSKPRFLNPFTVGTVSLSSDFVLVSPYSIETESHVLIKKSLPSLNAETIFVILLLFYLSQASRQFFWHNSIGFVVKIVNVSHDIRLFDRDSLMPERRAL